MHHKKIWIINKFYVVPTNTELTPISIPTLTNVFAPLSLLGPFKNKNHNINKPINGLRKSNFYLICSRYMEIPNKKIYYDC